MPLRRGVIPTCLSFNCVLPNIDLESDGSISWPVLEACVEIFRRAPVAARTRRCRATRSLPLDGTPRATSRTTLSVPLNGSLRPTSQMPASQLLSTSNSLLFPWENITPQCKSPPRNTSSFSLPLHRDPELVSPSHNRQSPANTSPQLEPELVVQSPIRATLTNIMDSEPAVALASHQMPNNTSFSCDPPARLEPECAATPFTEPLAPYVNMSMDDLTEHTCIRKCWMSVLDTGLLSAVIFFLAMVCYDISVPLCETRPHGVPCSHLNFWGAFLFTVESICDICWSLKARFAVEVLENVAQAHLSFHASIHPGSVEDLMNAPEFDAYFFGRQITPEGIVKKHCLDSISWDLWSAVFFFIPGMLAMIQSLMDPNVAGWTWLNLSMLHVSDDKFIDVLGTTIVWLYMLDSLIGLCGRWRYNEQTPIDKRKVIIQLWHAHKFFDVHWAAWGDVCFFFGASVDLYINTFPSLSLKIASESLWTLDAAFYFTASLPLVKATWR